MTSPRLPACAGRARSATALACLFAATAAFAQAPGSAQMGRVRDFFPTGDERSSILVLDRMAPLNIRVGTEFEYTLTLRNTSNGVVPNVVLTEADVDGLRIVSADPPPSERGAGGQMWTYPTIEPNGQRQIRFRAIAERVGDVTACANVVVQRQTCARLVIVQPQLQLVKTMPAEVTLCDPIPVSIVVTNPGSGVATNVVIRDGLPDGWTAEGGTRDVVFNVGDLPAGASREFQFRAKAAGVGSFRNCATAEAAGGLTANACAETRVIQPRLELVKSGPNERFLGRPAQFELTVRNVGDAIARDVQIIDNLPQGLRFTAASDGGQFGGNQVRWMIGALSPGQSRTVSLEAVCDRIGAMENTALASSYCAEAGARLPLVVRGIPAVLLEVIDVEDPDEIGTEENYVITVTNQGSADATNIRITCQVQPEAEFVSAGGDFGVTASVNGREVTFAPLPALAPRAKANFRVIVRGTQPGDTRFKVSMTTDQTTSPVEETESTRFY